MHVPTYDKGFVHNCIFNCLREVKRQSNGETKAIHNYSSKYNNTTTTIVYYTFEKWNYKNNMELKFSVYYSFRKDIYILDDIITAAMSVHFIYQTLQRVQRVAKHICSLVSILLHVVYTYFSMIFITAV